MRRLLPFVGLLLLTTSTVAQPPTILPERERARVVDELLDDRFTDLLPALMRREGIDCWVLISREYNRSGGPRRPGTQNHAPGHLALGPAADDSGFL